jgi:nucleotide-binding universal stress UspA family protein
MKNVKNILVPVDFSENCRVALDWAMSISEFTGANVILFHALEIPDILQERAQKILVITKDVKDQLKTKATKDLQTFAEKYDNNKINMAPEISEGKPFLEIIQAAKNYVVDLIVMGTHGHTGLKHMLIGSVAEKVVRKAHCPVLTVKHPDFKFEML